MCVQYIRRLLIMAFPLPPEHNAGGSMVSWIWVLSSVDYTWLLLLYCVRIVTMASELLFSYPNLKSMTKEKRIYFSDSLISVQWWRNKRSKRCKRLVLISGINGQSRIGFLDIFDSPLRWRKQGEFIDSQSWSLFELCITWQMLNT